MMHHTGRDEDDEKRQEPVKVDGTPLLTSIEALNLQLIAEHGFTLEKLAEHRGKSVHTINRQIFSAKLKLGKRGCPYTALVMEAARLGLIPPIGPQRPYRGGGATAAFPKPAKDL